MTALAHRFDTEQHDIGHATIRALPPIGVADRTVASPAPSLSLITTLPDFEALEAEWTALMERAGRPEQVFQSFAWNWHWSRHYVAVAGNRGSRMAVVTGRIDGKLVLIAPLVVNRIAGLRQLAWMGEPVSQYGDVVAAPEVAGAETIADALRFAARETRSDFANLRKVRADSLAAPALTLLGSRITGTEEAPFMRLDSPDYPTYEAGRSPKRRKNRARHMRRLQERGTVEFRTDSASADAADLAAHAVLMKRASLRDKGQVSPSLADPRFAAFFADVARGREHPIDCRVVTVRSGGEMAAMQVVIDHGAARFLHIAVFSSKFEKCGVGSLLLEHALKDCFARGYATFDLLAPKHEYKMDFADGTVAVDDHALALTRAGSVYIGTFLGLRQRAKRAIEAMPAPVRRAVDRAMALLRK